MLHYKKSVFRPFGRVRKVLGYFCEKGHTMLTKYKLKIGSNEYELKDDDLKNWDEIKCTYKRADFGGVVRSFTSKFEFVNKAYQLLMAEFDKNGLKAQASIELYVIDNNWNYHLEFVGELDFATLTYTDYALSISSVDNSVESVIKANKSTKYEFVVGVDIPVNGSKYFFDRLKMLETATYAITGGTSEDDGSLTGEYTTESNYRLYVGMTNSEIAIGGSIHPNDDQTDGDGYMFLALKGLDITVDYSITVGLEYGTAPLILMNNDTPIRQLHAELEGRRPFLYEDQFNIDDVMDYINSDPGRRHSWNNDSWRDEWVTVRGIVWVVEIDGTLGTNVWVNTGKTKAEYCDKEEHGTLTFHVNQGDKIWLKFDSDTKRKYKINKSSMTFTWTSRGSSVTIDSISPDELLTALIGKMGVGIDAVIDNYDSKFQNILILPAECIRGISGAKLYASFNDFCNWMETVFGYTYVINEEYDIIEFKHREDIFSEDAEVIDIDGAKDFEYKTESSVLYSSVVVGYDKKDYEGANGRDEFNFNSTYTTGYNNGKKLELKSPFRADSYGIEFLVEKRNQDTTDNSSDKDVFFVSGIDQAGYFQTNRTQNIKNSITGSLINGEFAPMQCVEANREYISLMAPDMELKFASTQGNGDIIINNIGMSDDLMLENCDMLTAGELKFSCPDQRIPKNLNCLIRVCSEDFIYEGFIRQVSFMMARHEAVDYTIMIKTKTPC